MPLPILTFHKLSKYRESNKYIVTEKDFVNCLAFMASHNYNYMLIENYYNVLLEPTRELPRKSVVITFDDGHESDFTIALPNLKKFNLKANFFITTDWIDKTGYMTSEQIKILSAEGMSIQSHSKTHLYLDEMDTCNALDELKESKIMLEKILGRDVPFISFPGGRYNRNVIDCAKEANYSAVLSSNPFCLKKISDILVLGRFMVKSTSDGTNIYKNIHCGKIGKIKAQILYSVKYLLKKILGKNLYYLLWKKYVGQ